MKKMVFLIMLVLAVLLAVSCTSPKPVASPDPEPVPLSQPQPQYQPQIIELVRHHNNIILDGSFRYEVQSGDILSGIAKRFYQDGSYYPLIMMVSDDVVKDPDVIEPGMILTVPDLDKNLSDARARNSINNFFSNIANIEEQRGRYGTAFLIRNHTKYSF